MGCTFFCWGSAIRNSPAPYGAKVSKIFRPPPPNLVSEILVYDGVETMEAVIKILWFLYLVHHSVFLLITHANSGSYSINLKTGKHAYSFDLIELFSVAGHRAVEKCTSRQT